MDLVGKEDGFALGVEVDKILVGATVGFLDGRGEDGMIVREEDGVADSLVVGTLDAKVGTSVAFEGDIEEGGDL